MNAIRMVEFFVLFTLACDNKNLDGPERYFADHKVGDSPDFGVFKHGTDHVISVHGFFEADMSVCLKIVKMLNDEEPESHYTCKPLNH
jgi:hypothetical protein